MHTQEKISTNDRLFYLDNLSDYKVHHNDPDIRDWDVKMRSGARIGKVTGLVADTDKEVVRYVDIELDDELISRASARNHDSDHRYTMVPVGMVRVDRDDKDVYISGVTYEQVAGMPRTDDRYDYSPKREIETMDYLSDYHEYGTHYRRNTYSTDANRNSRRLDDDFYNTPFYEHRNQNNSRS